MEREMDNELQFHIERYTEDLVREGVRPMRDRAQQQRKRTQPADHRAERHANVSV